MDIENFSKLPNIDKRKKLRRLEVFERANIKVPFIQGGYNIYVVLN